MPGASEQIKKPAQEQDVSNQVANGAGAADNAYAKPTPEQADRIVASKLGSASSKRDANGVGMEVHANGKMPDEELTEAANSAENDERAQLQSQGARAPVVFQIGNTGEINAAQRLMDDITGYRENLLKGIADGTIPTDVLKDNMSAVKALGDFLVSGGEQARMLSDFQGNLRQVRIDQARLVAQFEAVQKQTPGLRGSPVDAWGGEAQLRKQAAAVSANGSGQGGVHWTAMQNHDTELEKATESAATAQLNAGKARIKVSRALNEIDSGVIARGAKAVDGDQILKTTAALKSAVGQGLGKLLEHVKVPIAGKVSEAVADEAVKSAFAIYLNPLEAKTLETKVEQDHGVERQQVETLRAALLEWTAATIELHAQEQHAQKLKANLRDSARQFSISAEDRGEFEVGIISQLYAEADAYLYQVRMTRALGDAEIKTSANATADRNKVENSKPGLCYHEPIRSFHLQMRSTLDPRTVGYTYDALTHNLFFAASGLGSTEGERGVNPVIAASLKELDAAEKVGERIRSQLGGAIGFSRTNSSVVDVSATGDHR